MSNSRILAQIPLASSCLGGNHEVKSIGMYMDACGWMYMDMDVCGRIWMWMHVDVYGCGGMWMYMDVGGPPKYGLDTPPYGDYVPTS